MRNQNRFYPKFRFPLFLTFFLMVFFSFTIAYGAPSNLVKVPNVLNISGDNASQALKGVGLGVSVKFLPVDDPKYNNMVKTQSHQPGNLVTKGTVVTITVLQYTPPPPNLVKVPNVLNISGDNASQALKGVGLGVSVKFLPVDDPKYNNMVKTQSHHPGDMITKGTVVTITVLQYKR